MLLITLLRLFLGYVTFEGRGGFPERFINLCTKKKIPLWDLKNQQDRIVACTTIKGYKSIAVPARKAGMRVKLIKKHGIPFFINKNKKRKGMVLGLCLCIIIVSLMSTMVWSISVEGNEAYTEEQILEAFAENGVYIGAIKGRLDVRTACENVINNLNGISWAMVNIKGSSATIEIKESVQKPEMVDTATPINIVASSDGKIVRCEVYAGVQETKVGMTVLKGDLLVSGVIANKDLTERFVHAKANIIAETKHTLTSESENVLFSMSNERIKNTIFFFGIKIPFGILSDEGCYFKSESYLQSDLKRLPVGIIRERTAIYNEETTLSELQKQLLATEKYMNNAVELSQGVDILNQSISIAQLGDIFSIKGEYICEEEVGIEQEIFVEKTSD